jgi:hypothetical protein
VGVGGCCLCEWIRYLATQSEQFLLSKTIANQQYQCYTSSMPAKENQMATTKTVKQFSDKLVKINESFTINRYDNGFMVEAGGRNKKGDYVSAKIL